MGEKSASRCAPTPSTRATCGRNGCGGWNALAGELESEVEELGDFGIGEHRLRLLRTPQQIVKEHADHQLERRAVSIAQRLRRGALGSVVGGCGEVRRERTAHSGHVISGRSTLQRMFKR